MEDTLYTHICNTMSLLAYMDWESKRIPAKRSTPMFINVFYPGCITPEKKEVKFIPQEGECIENFRVLLVRHEVPTCDVKATVVLVY